MKAGTKFCTSVTVAVVGLVIAVVGLSFLHFFPIVFDKKLKEQTRLVEGNTGYEIWKNPPADIYIDFYVWHLENPLEVEKGVKPNVTQKGPYTYRENREKKFPQDNQNGTISYCQPERFIFDPVNSVKDPKTDSFTTINMPLLTVINQLQYMPEEYQYLFNIFATLMEKHTHATHTVHEFIWGYFSPLLAAAKILNPEMVPMDNFGIYVGKNNSYDGIYTVYNGIENYTKTNEIAKWNGMNEVSYWTTKYANLINGTDGTYFGQFLSKKENLYIFISDICRSVYAIFQQKTTTFGIPTWRYIVPKSVLANHSLNPSNTAFCTPDKNSCLPGGILNITDCKFGAPIYFSSPHFLDADDEIFKMITGVHPSKTLHQSYLDIEPYTGVPLEIRKRSQINTYIRSYDFIEFYRKVPEAYLPLVWIEERSLVTKEGVSQLEQQLMLPLAVGKYAPWAAFSFGILLFLVGVGFSFRHWTRWEKSPSSSINVVTTDEEIEPIMDFM